MKYQTISIRNVLTYLAVLSTGLFIGFAHGQSRTQPPAAHEGVSVVELGQLPESSLVAQIGLHGFVLKLREVTVAPGGAIAEHSHATRPGLVQTLSGNWTEVRDGKETDYPADKKQALLEDESTVHWLYNAANEPVTAVVCGLYPAT